MQDKILIPYLLYIFCCFRVHFATESHTHTHMNEFFKEKVFYILQHTGKNRFNVIFQKWSISEMEWNTHKNVLCEEKRWKKIDFGNWKAKKGIYHLLPCLFMQYRCCRCRVSKNKHQVSTSKLTNTSSVSFE